MSVLKGKKVLLGITAGIAAYKAAFLVRLLIKEGAEVKVVMTPSAKDFVTPLTLSTLSKNPVLSSFTNEEDENAIWNNHVDLGIWADLLLIAPATANTLAKMSKGISDNLLLATYLSAKCQVYCAPAMDLDMYQHESTKTNLKTLSDRGDLIIPAESGELASGLSGEGRMAEPENIVTYIKNQLASSLPLSGKKILITAGPTFEAIDPVRFIGNHSSGKMGFEIANRAAELGAEVVLISGPTHEKVQNNSIKVCSVVSAQDMYDEVHNYFKSCDVAILSAAVADYKPESVSNHKIKKTGETLDIKLVRTKDILKSLGDSKTTQFLVGFALETNNEKENALNKLTTKNLDVIVLNSLRDLGAGFGGSTNKVTFITSSNENFDHPLKSKREVAVDLWDLILTKINA